MAGKRKIPLWRQTFLRALARTGNVRASAFEAGVDKVTAYNHRRKDAAFAGKWVAALRRCSGQAVAKANPPSRKASADKGGRSKGGEMVLRRTRHGDQLVRAAAGRWSGRVEESFLAGLELTGCVRGAAAAAGISTAALYERRKHYPEFAARWDEVAGRAGQELPALLGAAARESLSRPPEAPGREEARARAAAQGRRRPGDPDQRDRRQEGGGRGPAGHRAPRRDEQGGVRGADQAARRVRQAGSRRTARQRLERDRRRPFDPAGLGLCRDAGGRRGRAECGSGGQSRVTVPG